jgi:S1-C subfamily serine protease
MNRPWKTPLAVFWFGLSCSLLFSQVAPPGKLTSIFARGTVTFHYPQNWQILDAKGNDDFLIGPPDATAKWSEWEQVENKKHRTERKLIEHTMVSHGVLCGYYEPNYPSLEAAADELLGRFRQRYGSLAYVEGSDQKRKANERPAMGRAVKIVENRLDPVFLTVGSVHWNTILEANGALLLFQDGERVWYWLVFAPTYDLQQYTPTFAAMLASITLDGKGIELQEVKKPAAAPQPHPNVNSELTAADIAKKSLPSVVVLTMQDSRGNSLKLGSGFFVHDNLIATNFHVIKGASSGYARLVGQVEPYRIDGTVAVAEDRDLALLQVSGMSASPLQLGLETVATGDTIYVVGNPEGLEGTFSQGIISSVRPLGDTEILQITAPISHGSSGGPVLNQHGEVVGVASAVLQEGQNLNFAIPASQLAGLLLKVGPVVPLSGGSSSQPKTTSKKTLGKGN